MYYFAFIFKFWWVRDDSTRQLLINGKKKKGLFERWTSLEFWITFFIFLVSIVKTIFTEISLDTSKYTQFQVFFVRYPWIVSDFYGGSIGGVLVAYVQLAQTEMKGCGNP